MSNDQLMVLEWCLVLPCLQRTHLHSEGAPAESWHQDFNFQADLKCIAHLVLPQMDVCVAVSRVAALHSVGDINNNFLTV